MSFPAKNLIPVPGVYVSETFKSSLYEAPDGREFRVAHCNIELFGGVDYMRKDVPICYIRPRAFRESMAERRRTLRQRLAKITWADAKQKTEFMDALESGKVRTARECEYRYITTNDSGDRVLNRITLGGLITSEPYAGN